MNIGIMGGTFDPIHYGHLALASEAAEHLRLDEVNFVPAGDPWQKADQEVLAARHRWEMTCRATIDDSRFTVSRVDIDRVGATYAIDTVQDLRQEYSEPVQLFFIIGADTLENLSTWHRIDQLWPEVTFAAVNRPGHSRKSALLPTDARIEYVDMPGIDVSSTDCRNRVRQGRSIRYLTPDSVIEYINEWNLYHLPALGRWVNRSRRPGSSAAHDIIEVIDSFHR